MPTPKLTKFITKAGKTITLPADYEIVGSDGLYKIDKSKIALLIENYVSQRPLMFHLDPVTVQNIVQANLKNNSQHTLTVHLKPNVLTPYLMEIVKSLFGSDL